MGFNFFMEKSNDHIRTGGAITHVGDCYVWAEIYYLDSASDFREYLPSPSQSELVMLDELAASPIRIFVQVLTSVAAYLARGFTNIAQKCFKMQK